MEKLITKFYAKTRNETCLTSLTAGYHPNPLDALERLFFALFGLTTVQDLKMSEHIEDWQVFLFIFISIETLPVREMASFQFVTDW